MAQHIEKPTKRTFWKVTQGTLIHEGYTEINQVTSTGDVATLDFSEDPTVIYPALPETGLLPENKIYSWNGKMVRVTQEHNRTEFTPEQTPNLFTVVRPNEDGGEWIIQEWVEIGDTRTYNGVTYQCISSHQTEFTPDLVPNLWKEKTVQFAEWKQPTGAHDAYQTGDIVTYEGNLWISKIDANTTVPDGDVPYNRYWQVYE